MKCPAWNHKLTEVHCKLKCENCGLQFSCDEKTPLQIVMDFMDAASPPERGSS